MSLILEPLLSHYFAPDGPGAALALVTEDQAPQIACLGLADVEHGTAITLDTIFELASATKTFTAAGILLLVEYHGLSLTAPVDELVPGMASPAAGRPVTIRDLLWHTSGLTDYLESGMYTPADQLTAAFVTSQLPDWSRAARPGEHHAYSNTNYVVLARVIETISGLGFAEFIHSKLLAPHGLHSTFVTGHGGERAARVARGYRNFGYGLPAVEPAGEAEIDMVGDGGIFSSLNDLIRWQSLLWGGQIVNEPSLTGMRTPGHLDSEECFEYGFGLQIERRPNGQTWWGHGGSWTNTTTLIGRYPNERATVIVLSNEFMAPVERISQRALALSRGLAPNS